MSQLQRIRKQERPSKGNTLARTIAYPRRRRCSASQSALAMVSLLAAVNALPHRGELGHLKTMAAANAHSSRIWGAPTGSLSSLPARICHGFHERLQPE